MKNFFNVSRLVYVLFGLYAGWIVFSRSVIMAEGTLAQVLSGLVVSMSLVSFIVFKHAFIRFGYMLSIAMILVLFVLHSFILSGIPWTLPVLVGTSTVAFIVTEALYWAWARNYTVESKNGIHIYHGKKGMTNFLLRLSSMREKISRPLIVSVPDSEYLEVLWKGSLLSAVICPPERLTEALARWESDYEKFKIKKK